MNKNETTWHNFYSNHQRKRDEDRKELTPYRQFKHDLWTAVEKEGFLTKIEIIQSLTNHFYLKCRNLQIELKLSNEDSDIKASIGKSGNKIEEINGQPIEVSISKFIELIKMEDYRE